MDSEVVCKFQSIEVVVNHSVSRQILAVER